MALSLLIQTLLLVICADLIYNGIRSYISTRHFRKFALENGCEPPPMTKSAAPWSLDTTWRILRMRHTGEDLLDDIIVPAYASTGPTRESIGLLGQHMLHTIEPANVQAVLATKFRDFEIGARRHAQFGALFGRNIFTSDGKFWEHSRALFRPQFSREQINDLDSTEKATRALFEVLPAREEEDGWTGGVDLMPLLFRFTLDTATEFLFGTSVDSQLAAAGSEGPSPPPHQGHSAGATAAAAGKAGADVRFAEAFQTAQAWLSYRIRLQGLYWLADGPKLRKSVKVIRDFTDHFVRLALQPGQRDEGKTDPPQEGGKRKYVLLEAMAKDTQDPVELRDQLLGILVAGRDTTAALLSWVFLTLSQHPSTFTKLRQTILTDFGPAPTSTPITFASLKSCRYLQHVLSETLRLYTVVPLNLRVAVRDTVLPAGGGADGTRPVAVRSGQTVNYSPYAMHRRRELWGEDAAAFRPERWEGRKVDWSFVPFSGGPRICLGQQYALVEASYLVVRMLQRFDKIEYVGSLGPGGKIKRGIGLGLFPADGVKNLVNAMVTKGYSSNVVRGIYGRGVNLKDLPQVIHYDLPETVAQYMSR